MNNIPQQTKKNYGASDKILYSLIENTADSIWAIDREYKITAFNSFFAGKLYEAFNIKIEIGLQVSDYLPDSIKGFWRELYNRALSGERFTEELKHNGEYFELSLNPIFEEKEVVGASVFSRNITERKETQFKLVENEELFRNAFDYASIGMVLVSPDGRFIKVNQSFCLISGYQEKELLEMTFLDITSPEDRNKDYDNIQLLLNGKTESYSTEKKYIHKNNSIFWGFVNVSIIWDSQNKPLYFMASVIDINEKKVVREELLKSEKQLSTACKISNIGSWEFDLLTNEITYSQELYEILGYDPKIFKPTINTAFDLIHPEDKVGIILKYNKSIANSEPATYEYRIIRPDGNTRFLNVHAHIIKDETGKLIKRIGVIQDITERKKTEEELRESEEKFRSAFDYASNGMALLSPEGKFIKVNKALCNIVGFTEEELLQKAFQDITHPDDLEKVLIYAGQILAGEIDTYQIEKRYLHNQGHIIWILLSCSLVHDIYNRPLYFITQIKDITSRKQAEVELLLSNKELASSNQDLEAFAYIASHDLQEPLRAITGYFNLLSNETELKKSKDLINQGSEASARMRLLIHDLLLYSRVGRHIESENVDCNIALENVISNLQLLIGENNASVTYEKLPVIKADYLRIEQLFQNLISNAIKYHKPDLKPKIHIYSFVDNRKHVFIIKDNGIGISQEYFELIFQIFKRLHKNNEFSGTGIGLAICKKIVEKLNGDIWVKSSPGKGSEFYFSIPQ
jgi:PAS domain S-box-containing protein